MSSPFSHLTPNDVPCVKVDFYDVADVENWNEDDSEELVPRALSRVGYLLEDSEVQTVIARSYDWIDEKWSEFALIPKTPPEIHELIPKPPELPEEE